MALPDEIQTEMDAARGALESNNTGKARVCARRAVGKAFAKSKYCKEYERIVNANEIVKLIADDKRFSIKVRDAARRLSTRVTEEGISERPFDDAAAIIEALLFENQ